MSDIKTCGRIQVPIRKLVKLIESMGGNVEETRNGDHPFKAIQQGIRPCPLGKSTDYMKMVVPWMKKAFEGVYDPNYVKASLRVQYA